jgi:hypothetical protein
MLRFARSTEHQEFTSQQPDLPAFLGPPPDEIRPREPVARVAANLAESAAKRWRASKNRLSQSFRDRSFAHRLQKDTELIARVAFVLLLAPLAIAFSPSELPRVAKIEQPIFVLEDRLSFGEGLRRRLASRTVSSLLEPAALPDANAEAAPVPPEDPAKPSLTPQAPRTTVEPTVQELPVMIMGARRWSLPFNSQEYAITGLAASPQASFKTEVEVSSFTEEAGSVAAQNDEPAIGPLVQPKRPAKRGKRVLAYSRRIPRIRRTPPAVVETVIVERQEPSFPPLLFFLGAPPPPEPLLPEENAAPKKQSSFPESFQDLFKND